MKIRVIGNKKEIDGFFSAISEVYPEIVKSKLYPAREETGSYRCYITVNGSLKGGEIRNAETG